MKPKTIIPSLLVFGPQSELPSQNVLADLRQELVNNPRLSGLHDAVKTLPKFWETLINFDPSLTSVPGAEYLGDLQRWIVDGGNFPHHVSSTPNTYALPVTVLLQITQYVVYLDRLGIKDPHRRVLKELQAGGIQGFCTGFLSAIAVSGSETEAHIATAAAVSLRLAVCIGAYVDQDGGFDGKSNHTSCLSIRWRSSDANEKDVLHYLGAYPDAYVSSITDDACVTVTAKTSDLADLTAKFKAPGFRVKIVPVQGRFHSAIHASSAEKLLKFSAQSAELRFPSVDKLQAPVRSAVDGEIIIQGSLTRLALENTLLKRANWYKTLQGAILGLPGSQNVAALAGFGNHIPPSLLQNSALQVLSLHTSDNSGKPTETPPVNGLPKEGVQESDYPPHSIAIVGMSGRFPGADSLDELWELLMSGKSMVERAPSERLRLPGAETGDNLGTQWWGNFLRNPDAFDHKFFKKSSREAIAWDPQQRILLEVVYEALESAGYFGATANPQPDDYGCYIGAVMNNYYDNVSCHPATAYATLGTSRCFLSGCMSHYFGWTGPSLTIDTACSSSLVAINTACRAIWSGECSRAIAGGTNIFTSPFDYQNLRAAGFLSPNGQCKPFDASADGYCRGEGVGVIVLKPLATAIKENDNILGVIVGSAANQNQNLSHITVPHSGSQVKLYQNVMKLAGVEPGSVTYVEAHGTGTGVGDPIESQSIREAFGGPSRDSTLHFGSIKGNIGHTEATAGIAGLIKVLLMMQHGKIPAQASHTSLNPKIPALEPDRMAIPRSVLPWNPAFQLACVNSYGAAGSNAAVMVRQKPAVRTYNGSYNAQISKYPLFISAASVSSLLMYCQKLVDWLKQVKSKASGEIRLSDLAFNLADIVNHALPYIVSTTVTDVYDLETKLSVTLSRSSAITAPTPKPVVLVFGGQESDFIGLSEDVYQSSSLFRNHLDECSNILISLGFEGLYPAIFQHAPVSNLVTLHSALFSVQYASAKSWIDSGLEVSAVVGHSFGQLTALCISGTLSLQDALKLVAGRASIMLEYWGSEPGSMLFLQADREKVSTILDSLNARSGDDNVEVACYNGPKSHVVVGSTKAIDAMEKFIASSGSVRTKTLKVTHGFHSKFTDPLLSHLTSLAKELVWKRPIIHLETCDDYQSITEPDFSLVARHMRHPVFFQRAVERLTQRFSHSTWLEVGRGSSVIQLVRGSVSDSQSHLFLSPQLTTANAQSSLTDTTTDLWNSGYAVQYWPFHRSQRSQYEFLSLPSYQFEKTQHWLPFTGRGKEVVPEPAQEIPITYELLTFLRFADDRKQEAIFRIAPQSDRFKSMLGGHVMAGQSLAPASLYFEVASRAALFLQSDTTAKVYVPSLEDLVMKSPIGLDTTKDIILSLKRVSNSQPSWSFSITSQAQPSAAGRVSQPFEQSTGTVHLKKRDDTQTAQDFKRFETLTGSRRYEEIMNHPDAEKMQGKHIYRAFNHIVHYAENFRGIKTIACLGLEAAGRVTMEVDTNDPVDQRLCDTPMTDSFMQFGGFLVNYFNNPSLEDVLVCSKIGHIEIGGDFTPDAKEWIVYSNMRVGGETDALSDAYIFEAESKKMVMAAFGFQFSKMSQSLLARMLASVNKSNAPKKPAENTVSHAIEEPLVESSKAPSKPIKRSSSKRADILKILHDVTDIALEDLKDESTLEDLGIDSLMATEVLNDIRSILGLTVDLSDFLFFANIEAISNYVDSKLGGGDDEESDANAINTPDTEEASPTPNRVIHSLQETPTPVSQAPVQSLVSSNRPSIISAYDAFKEVRLGYDHLAVGTKAVNFWKDAYPDQAKLVLAYVVEAYAKIGCDLKTLKPGDTVPEVHSLHRHKQVVRQFYRVLEDGHLISATKSGFFRTDIPLDTTPAESLYQKIIDPWPQHANVNHLVKVVGSQLAACLTGEIDALQLVFGNREVKKVLEDMYANWPLLRTPTLLLGDFLIKAFTNFNGSGKFRILEIGAGTGGTTRYLIKHLRNHGIPFEYKFTDISMSLVAAARKEFKDVEGMTFELLDIEKPPIAEYEGAFHVILATNCIHATRNLDLSLSHLRKMLREDGALTLVEITKNMFWLDIVVGLFEGWWLFEDGRSHALIDEKYWEQLMKKAGFGEVLWTDGDTPESKTVRVIGAFPAITQPSMSEPRNAKKTIKASLETVVYKKLGDKEIHADVYYPVNDADIPSTKMPIALMIHGGSHMIFSRKDIRPAQTRLLLEKGFLPVSLDHRLCPEIKLAEGPMVDICDALEWARYTLPQIQLKRSGLRIDGERVVVVGWSSGGQLAMSLAWTAPQRGLRPPEAILAFYCPTNYEDEWWKHPIQPVGAEDQGDEYDILEAIQDDPITNYGIVGAWEPLSDPRIRTDPRCRIVLHINWKAQTLPVIIGGLVSKKKAAGLKVQDWKNLAQPELEEIIPVSPLAQIVRGNYQTPTFFIHGTNDELIPWQQSKGTYDALLSQGVTTGLALIEGAPHICDLSSDAESEGWKATLRGYEFLCSYVF